jgi:predicted RNase H-like HicB family nuclease
MNLKVVVHQAEEGGFWAEVPALPGCVSQGETLDELRTNIREAIEGWLMVDDEIALTATEDQVIEIAV